ncbi:C-5 sterol desaturase [Rhizophagus irregularis DAOM 181602=DAOM 197198]|nr:C-5 sterol desaturase [Rhizophagus irregularis DAOM 181602=DAOM 197198]
MTPEFEQKDPDFYKQNYVNGVYLNYASPDSPTSSKRDSRGSVKRHSFYVLRENKSFNRRGIMLRIVIRIIYDASRIPLRLKFFLDNREITRAFNKATRFTVDRKLTDPRLSSNPCGSSQFPLWHEWNTNPTSKEIKLSAFGFPITSIVTVPWFLGEVRGYSALYDDINQYGLLYAVFSIFGFLFFTDMCIYWIHRWLHHPLIYKHLHKAHHRWIIPTPFSSHAFHPLDGYLQSVPYHIFVYLFPLHKFLYISLFIFVNLWTIMIHDGEFLSTGTFVNGAAHHVLHHLYFNYNYGQYFTIWDKIGGSYRKPGVEQFDIKKKKDQNIWEKQATEVDSFDENGKEKKA